MNRWMCDINDKYIERYNRSCELVENDFEYQSYIYGYRDIAESDINITINFVLFMNTIFIVILYLRYVCDQLYNI